MRFLLCLLLTGCASTTFYADGKPVLKTQADIAELRITKDGFYARGLSHSKPTEAGGRTATAIGGAIATGLMAIPK